jgi:hypothetical protein
MQGGLIPSALRAVGEGLSANQWAAAIRESGAGIRRQVALRIYGQARALAAEYGQEPTRPIGERPGQAESRQWPTRASSGVLQTVQLFYRERVTGNIVQRFFNVKTTEGITREEAISQAIGANSANAQRYEQELIGAVHTGTALLVPQSAA